MTIDERLDRIEHWTAGWADERKKDREEYKSLWRDTQRQLNELSTRLLQYAEESREADKRLEDRINQLTQSIQDVSRADQERGKALDERIDKLVSGFGKHLLDHEEKPKQ